MFYLKFFTAHCTKRLSISLFDSNLSSVSLGRVRSWLGSVGWLGRSGRLSGLSRLGVSLGLLFIVVLVFVRLAAIAVTRRFLVIFVIRLIVVIARFSGVRLGLVIFVIRLIVVVTRFSGISRLCRSLRSIWSLGISCSRWLCRCAWTIRSLGVLRSIWGRR